MDIMNLHIQKFHRNHRFLGTIFHVPIGGFRPSTFFLGPKKDAAWQELDDMKAELAQLRVAKAGENAVWWLSSLGFFGCDCWVFIRR